MSGGSGRVVVVTGGTRGIGLGLARELIARGCRVVVCGRSAAAVDDAVAGLAGLAGVGGPQVVTGLATDVTSRVQVQALWDHAVATFGRVDVWINNAGMSAPRGPLPELSEETFAEVVATNLVGVANGCAVALPGLQAQAAGGWLWNMEGFGSNGQHQPGLAAYGATKRAVTYLTESLVRDAKGGNVKVGFLSPGIVATDLLTADYDGQPEAFEKARRIFNILGDRVETVTPWLAEHLLDARKNGARVAWLTTPKVMGRFLTAGFRTRDIFAAPAEAR
ncbi:SDR family oxidoreductase [Nocardioides sp. cx-173]|uniref:SDR family oxidoreductase n=1 Tax=Nocardioides sp. cx-173 TaxID=2898796 RepID=UPI001E28F269|nr:SDR family oxidoreductase [Nocardioides sp. cx-173]MCD4524389.1 SDR family oxidoreductase [Nocardioides sp. cx-173]UGB43123.1 SDR family oxidoreductase [Nocardioides sp. cx-173]